MRGVNSPVHLLSNFCWFRQFARELEIHTESSRHLLSKILSGVTVQPHGVSIAEAAKLNPRDADAQYNLGNAFVAKGDTAEAIKAYSAAIRADWRNANAYVARAIAQLLPSSK